MSNHELLAEKNINLKGRTNGQIKTQCPFCSDTRKNPKDPSLSVNIDEGLYTCHHCGEKGRVYEKKIREYVKPQPRLEKLQKKFIDWFENTRKISNNTLLTFKITEAVEWMPQFEKEVPVVCFNYYRDDTLVNIKFRGAQKAFKMAKDAELIFYNLNALKEYDEIVIVEGEIDCLACYEAGIYNVISVPNGATKGAQKLEYLDNCIEWFKDVKKVIIATDSDEAGVNLRDELARRLDKERCYKVSFPEDCKDANEVLIKLGKQALKEIIEAATRFPIEGILTMDELFDDVLYFYEHGYPSGTAAMIPGFDEYMTFMGGQFTMITGSPSSGKSEFLDWIIANTIKHHKWSWAVCSFENQPSSLHVTKLLEKLTGKAFGFRKDSSHRINVDEFEYGVAMIDQYVHFLNINVADLSLLGLLAKCKELVSRKGIKGIVIDPWNFIEHKQPKNQTETQYINDCLTEIKVFCIQNDVHLFLVAHPTKLKKEGGKYEVATMYHINGSAHFYNKADNGLSVYRDFSTGIIDVHIQKVRYSWLGKQGFCSFNYNTDIRQYVPILTPTNGVQKQYKSYYEPEENIV